MDWVRLFNFAFSEGTLDNKYRRWYIALVDGSPLKNPNTPYDQPEVHHPIPRCIGGPNYWWNRRYLHFNHHFLAHWLLTKFTTGSDRNQMYKAFCILLTDNKNLHRVGKDWQYRLAAKLSRLIEVSDESKERAERTKMENAGGTSDFLLWLWDLDREADKESKRRIGDELNSMVPMRQKPPLSAEVVALKNWFRDQVAREKAMARAKILVKKPRRRAVSG